MSFPIHAYLMKDNPNYRAGDWYGWEPTRSGEKVKYVRNDVVDACLKAADEFASAFKAMSDLAEDDDLMSDEMAELGCETVQALGRYLSARALTRSEP